jgi:hypothetical protein
MGAASMIRRGLRATVVAWLASPEAAITRADRVLLALSHDALAAGTLRGRYQHRRPKSLLGDDYDYDIEN